ncbi:MAG TPA: efflux RND transporter permease subunit [Nevskiales bacterium]|nr:efflux RND transporter permease subunit [Nevskiales bacterium]
MVLSDVCIRRPVFATVLSLLLVLVGLIAYQRLSVREYPNIDPPVITVETRYRGASAEIVETQVTKVLEESLAGIDGIDIMTSISREEQSQITVTFKLNRDPDGAASDVRDRVGRMRQQLPDEIDEPVIQKTEADANPIIWVALSSDRHTPLEVSDTADRVVKDRLQTLPGVALVRIFGERRYAMRLYLDPERLAGHGLTVQDVEDALRAQNVELPAGRIESRQREFTVLSATDLNTPQEFNDLIIRESDPARGAYLVRLRDVGRAELGPADERRIARFNGRDAIGMGVIKQATANPLDVSRAVRGVLPEVQRILPEGMRIDVANDTSLFIERSIENVYESIGEAIVLVVLIIFFFLRSFRATLIPLVTIPVSLIGSFAIMYLAGFSVNTLTLLAMVLAIGLVVDDAIVMLENIHRHVEQGMPPLQAARVGSKEIGFAVIAMTLTLAAVFAPVGFLVGTTGRLFTEFAWTLAATVLVSGFVALSLSPMMCSRLLRHEERHGAVYNVIEGRIDALTQAYRRLLLRGLDSRLLVLMVGGLVAASAVWLFTSIKEELAPTEDRGNIVGRFVAPEGATVEYTDRYARQIEQYALALPEVNRAFVVSGFPTVTEGIAIIRLVDWAERERSQQDLVRELGPKLQALPGVQAFAVNPPSLGQQIRNRPLEVVIKTTDSYEALAVAVDRMMQRIAENPGIQGPDTDLKLNKPQIRVSLDRDKAAAMGVDVATVGRTLETLLGGRQVTRFKQAGEQYDVIVQLADADRRTPADVNRLYVRGSEGAMIPLSNLVSLRESVAPKELNHFSQLRAARISANLAPDYALGEALAYVEAVAQEQLPPSMQLDYAGLSREFKQSSAELYFTFLLALAFIYLVLAAQFESFVDPLIIMLTVPLSMAGALLMLKLTGGTLNIYSKVGLITLIGLITKHGILIVEFANQLQAAGRNIHDAVVEAAVLRLRPILMTTGAMVLGALPLAIATGAGAESRQAIGGVIIGGLLVGTFFTLFVIPAVYTLIARRHERIEGEAEPTIV